MSQNTIPWFQPKVDENEKIRVAAVLDSGYLNDGPVTRELETKIAQFIGVKHCVGVTSGTTAISLSLMGLGIGHGDEVLVPDLTFIATANAVRMTGADVKLVDVRAGRFDIDPEKIKKAVGPKTKAIVPVDVNGRGADYRFLENFCKERNLFLVCDAAEALGSKFESKYLGTYGDAGCFSFSANKTVTTGQGGMIATNNSLLHQRLLELKDQGRRQQGTGGNDLHPVMGYNFKLTNLQAAVGLAQLEKLSARLEKANERDRWYMDLLSGVPGIDFPDYRHSGEVRQWTDILVRSKRDELSAALSAEGIGNRPFWYPLHRQKPYQQDDRDYSNTVSISDQGLWLPSSFDLTFEQAKRAASAVRSILTK